MSTAASAPMLSSNATPSRAKCLSFLKSQPRYYSPWRDPMSERQINAYFERQILPELSTLLEGACQDLTENDREDAVQDSVCQALEAYRVLKLYEISRESDRRGETALVLAKFASSQYLTGARFASPRSYTRL